MLEGGCLCLQKCESELLARGREEQALQAAQRAAEASCGHAFTTDMLMHRSSARTPAPFSQHQGSPDPPLVHLGVGGGPQHPSRSTVQKHCCRAGVLQPASSPAWPSAAAFSVPPLPESSAPWLLSVHLSDRGPRCSALRSAPFVSCK